MARSRLLICLASACISVAALGLAAPAAHADATCNGTIGVAVVVGNVIVPPGASCQLLGTTVTGNVQFGQGSQLLTENANVAGNIQGEGATRVRIYNTLVTDIQLKKVTFQILIGSDRTCKADPLVLGRIQLEENSANIGICKMSTRQDVQLIKNTGRILVDDNTIGEDLQVGENTNHVRIRFNEVGENVEVIKNTGGVMLNGNTAGMRIQCNDNNPPPVSYIPNTAPFKEGQCAGF
jgi:hypothetical protein